MPFIGNSVKQSRRIDPLSKPNPHHHLWPPTEVLRAPENGSNPIDQYQLCSSQESGLNENTNGFIQHHNPWITSPRKSWATSWINLTFDLEKFFISKYQKNIYYLLHCTLEFAVIRYFYFHYYSRVKFSDSCNYDYCSGYLGSYCIEPEVREG